VIENLDVVINRPAITGSIPANAERVAGINDDIIPKAKIPPAPEPNKLAK